jgi:flagellar motor switch protein FliM
VHASVGELSGLEPGRLLRFDRNSNAPASLLVAGVETFRALPARRGTFRIATLLERSAPAEEKAQE